MLPVELVRWNPKGIQVKDLQRPCTHKMRQAGLIGGEGKQRKLLNLEANLTPSFVLEDIFPRSSGGANNLHIILNM